VCQRLQVKSAIQVHHFFGLGVPMVKKEQLMFYYMACRHATSSIQNTYTDHRNMLLLIRPDRKHRDLNTGFPVHRSTVLVLARFGNLEPPERAARLQGLSSAGDANCPRHGDPVLVQGRAVEERASCHPPGPPLAGHGLPALGGGGARRPCRPSSRSSAAS
jgi:hypothetical protein